jgi:hypothetical protein
MPGTGANSAASPDEPTTHLPRSEIVSERGSRVSATVCTETERWHRTDMGLDNFPHRYPCSAREGVVRVDGRIDCEATVRAGSCPWRNRVDRDRPGEAIVGMLGTFCWWRGQVSTWHLELLDEAGYTPPAAVEGGFYGAEGDEPQLSPEYCRGLAGFLADHAEVFAQIVHERLGSDAAGEEIGYYRYSVWWLRFAAEEGEGAGAWW